MQKQADWNDGIVGSQVSTEASLALTYNMVLAKST